MSITSYQIKAAIALAAADKAAIAEYAGISIPQLTNIEAGRSEGSAATINRIVEYLENKGVVFTKYGVEKRPDGFVELKGISGLRGFYDDVYYVANNNGGSFCIFNGVPSLIIKTLGEDYYEAHAKRMEAIKSNYDFKVIIEHGDTNFIGSKFVEYRWFPKDQFNEKTVYIYGNKVAFISWGETPHILIINQVDIAAAQRSMFDCAWRTAEPVQT